MIFGLTFSKPVAADSSPHADYDSKQALIYWALLHLVHVYPYPHLTYPKMDMILSSISVSNKVHKGLNSEVISLRQCVLDVRQRTAAFDLWRQRDSYLIQSILHQECES